jgi:peptidoglycan/LPS O-acetylase OafA/YrhL
MDTSREIRPLTSLRLLAALLVFLSHYSVLPYGHAAELWQSIVIEGHAGVTIFFVLSGFLIALRYFPSMADGTFSTYPYFLKRAARILPLYWTLLGITLLVDALTPYQTFTPAPIVNWTLTQSYFSQLVLSGIIVAWSLSVEESFYLIAPLILYSCVRAWKSNHLAVRPLVLWAVGLFAVGLVLNTLSPALGLAKPYGFMDSTFVMAVYTVFGRGIDFCLGVFFGLFYLRRSQQFWTTPMHDLKATALFLIPMLGIFGLQMLMNAAGGLETAWYLNPLIALMAGFMIIGLTCPTAPISRLFSRRLPVYMGRISYALYLLQATPIARLILAMLDPAHILALPAMYVNLSLLSAFFYEVVERPCRSLILRTGMRIKTWLPPSVASKHG